MRDLNTALAMTSGKKFLRNTAGIAAVLCAVAVPGYCGTATSTIDFSGGSGGTISASTTVGGVVNAGSFTVPFNQLFIAGAADAADDGTWLLTSTALTMTSGDVFTLSGTVGVCVSGTCTGGGTNLGGLSGTLETFTVGSMLESSTISNTTSAYNVSGGTSFTMEFGAPTSLSDAASLLSKLGESGGITTPYTTNALGNINASGTTTGSTFTTGAGGVTSSNDDTTVTYTTAATPEPVSFILLGTGLVGVGLISRRRSAARI